MATLWPTGGASEPTRASDALRRALAHAVILADAGAGALALRDNGENGESDPLTARRNKDGLLITSGIERPQAAQMMRVLAEDLTPRPLDGRPRVIVNSELWGGEIASLVLGDLSGPAGELHLLGPTGFSAQRALTEPRRRQALIGELTAAVRLYQEASRLRQENRQLSSILHFSGDGIITLDAALRITGFNPAMEVMTAWRQHEVIGRFYQDVLLPRDLQGNPLSYQNDPVVRTIEMGKATVNHELILLARDGERVYVSVTAAVVRAAQGQPVSCVLNVRDITRSRESEELRNTFVSVVSHELQTPIAIIKGYASTLAREDAHWDTATLRARLQAIEEESDRLNHLLGNMLYASRISAGGLTMERTDLDLAEVTRSVVRRFKARSPDRDINVRLPAQVPLVLADRERIEEVLLNLLDNAVKYSPKGQSIRVRGSVTADDVILSVADSGEGIPAREQERVFERFQRVDNSTARRTQGAGLGLYICRAIVEAHGGRIWVRSTLGRGSTFSFSLPREEKPQAPMVIFGGHDRAYTQRQPQQQQQEEPDGATTR
ncbi:MAG: Two-component system sensor histidine kinase [Ktedonobacterales bacterium]|jgi:PAS domain S-box-containing protein|nr:MAG: Two-component system sensor histidine kinase [Ktedonobacterales bacterium]